MSDIAITQTAESLAKVQRLEDALAQFPAVDVPTTHLLHGGVYARTVFIPAGTVATSVTIDIPTTLIVNGECTFFVGNESMDISGYVVLPAAGGRRAACLAHTDTQITALFPTLAQTVEEAENECVREGERLASRKSMNNHVLITRTQKCLS